MNEVAPISKRRILRFSLRAMLLLVVVIGGTLGWTMHKVREQGIAVAALEKMGCNFSYSPDHEPMSVLARLRAWFGERKPRDVVGVSANGHVTDAGLAHLRGLTQLKLLYLNSPQVSDAGLAYLHGLTKLRYLHIDNTQVTDAGLAHLQPLVQLQELSLNGTQVTDAGLVGLEEQSQLLWLYLNGTQVTNGGVIHLRRLHRLVVLELKNTQVTDTGVENLQRALPNLTIEH